VPQRAREARVRIGVLPQADSLDPDFTVEENLLVYGRYFDLPPTTLRARIPALLEFAGLGGRARARLQTLSGGMRRRLALARALVNDPDLVFLDEPTTGLDPQARHLIWERLRGLLAQGKTLFLTTHFMDEAERLCHRIAIMDHGRIIAEGPPRELVARHIEPQVIEVYGEGAERWAQEFGRVRSERCERVGETLFCYAHEADPLVHDLEGRAELRFLHRPANLEDVFLKLTGRDLRD
jgi:lipooligosaccharide transport system ATP-binding protein